MSAARAAFLLERMRQAAADAYRFVSDVEKSKFMEDVMLQRAVGMSLLMASEMAVQLIDKHLEFLGEHPEFPWAAMRGMRNRIAHGYFDIDLDKVWVTAQSEAMDLVQKIDAIRHWRAQRE